MTNIELLKKHTKYVKHNKIKCITDYNAAQKPDGYYRMAQSLYKRCGKDEVVKAFGWRKTKRAETPEIPSNLRYDEHPLKNFIIDWYNKLPKKKTFTVVDCMPIWSDKHQSNVSNILIYMANTGLLQRVESIDVSVGRPKAVYTRSANWKFRPFNSVWSIAKR